MSETNCNNPLYRTYQVTKAIIVVPPLVVFGGISLASIKLGVFIVAPIDYIVNGNVHTTFSAVKRAETRVVKNIENIGNYLIS